MIRGVSFSFPRRVLLIGGRPLIDRSRRNIATSNGFVFFWRPEEANGLFGQWWPSKFMVDGKEYVTAEQYMMAGKARLFGDNDVELQIIKTTDPKKQKALGRKVQNFDEQAWKSNCVRIVTEGNLAKFTQDADLKKSLLETGKKTLVEASPLDKIWGIGMDSKNQSATKPAEWKGTNLLGVALMKARDVISANPDVVYTTSEQFTSLNL